MRNASVIGIVLMLSLCPAAAADPLEWATQPAEVSAPVVGCVEIDPNEYPPVEHYECQDGEESSNNG